MQDIDRNKLEKNKNKKEAHSLQRKLRLANALKANIKRRKLSSESKENKE